MIKAVRYYSLFYFAEVTFFIYLFRGVGVTELTVSRSRRYIWHLE